MRFRPSCGLAFFVAGHVVERNANGSTENVAVPLGELRTRVDTGRLAHAFEKIVRDAHSDDFAFVSSVLAAEA